MNPLNNDSELIVIQPSFLKRDKHTQTGSTTNFKENDDVVFFAETQAINKLEKLLSTH